MPGPAARERLGHSDIRLTANTYTHVDDHLDRAAAQSTDTVLRALLTKGERWRRFLGDFWGSRDGPIFQTGCQSLDRAARASGR